MKTNGIPAIFACTHCFQQVEAFPLLKPFGEDSQIPLCQRCSWVLKPDVVLFGEQLQQRPWIDAQCACGACDSMMVESSSSKIMRVDCLPMQAPDRVPHLLIINGTPTCLDVPANAVIRGNDVDIIPAIAEKVPHG